MKQDTFSLCEIASKKNENPKAQVKKVKQKKSNKNGTEELKNKNTIKKEIPPKKLPNIQKKTNKTTREIGIQTPKLSVEEKRNLYKRKVLVKGVFTDLSEPRIW